MTRLFSTTRGKTYLLLKAIRDNESAITSIEYALLGALIAVIIVVSVATLSTGLLALYNLVSTQLALAL